MSFDPNTPRSRDEVLLRAIVSGDSSAMGEPRDREEEFVKAIADKEPLPDYSEASDGDVLQIGTDGPEWGAVPNELPAIAAGDAGKVLKVNAGETGTEWAAAGGKKYYRHIISLKDAVSNTKVTANFELINDDPTKYITLAEVKTALQNAGFIGSTSSIPICFTRLDSGGLVIHYSIYNDTNGIRCPWKKYSVDPTTGAISLADSNTNFVLSAFNISSVTEL